MRKYRFTVLVVGRGDVEADARALVVERLSDVFESADVAVQPQAEELGEEERDDDASANSDAGPADAVPPA